MSGMETPEDPWELSTVSGAIGDVDRPPGTGHRVADRALSQRRVLQAVLSIVAVSGYGSLSVATIIRTSGVSRRGFNMCFSSSEEAFVAAHDQCMGQLVGVVRSAIDVDDVPEQQLRRGLRAAVDYLIADPARAEAVLMEVHVAGHRARKSHEHAVEALVTEAYSVLVRCGFDEPLARRLSRLGIGALREAIRSRITRGELRTLPAVVDELSDAAFPLRAIGAPRPLSATAASPV